MGFKALVAVAALLAASVPAYAAVTADAHSTQRKDPVIFVGGGSIDDDAASVLLLTMGGIDYRGIVVTNTDDIYNYAMQAQWRLQSYLGRTSLPITLSRARGWNSFPWSYRSDCITVHDCAVLSGFSDNAHWPPYPSGEAFLKRQLTRAVQTNRPITLLITAPLTPLSDVLKENRRLARGVKRLIWMGGAIDVPGNLDPTTIPPQIANPKAEWNAFWDPQAVSWVFKNTSFPIVEFPLDVTNEAHLTPAFMASLDAQAAEYRYSNAVDALYSLVEGEPYFEMWNSLTTAYLAHPAIFAAPVPMKLTIETEGYMQGAITRDPKGRAMRVVMNIKDKDAFYTYVLNQLKRN